MKVTFFSVLEVYRLFFITIFFLCNVVIASSLCFLVYKLRIIKYFVHPVIERYRSYILILLFIYVITMMGHFFAIVDKRDKDGEKITSAASASLDFMDVDKFVNSARRKLVRKGASSSSWAYCCVDRFYQSYLRHK